MTTDLSELKEGLSERLFEKEIDVTKRTEDVPHAPKRAHGLSVDEQKLALANALRYIPEKYHDKLGKEFYNELQLYGHIYMYRFRPTSYEMKAYPIDLYPAKSKHAAGVMLMIMNNLDRKVAQYPHEAVTYGGNGSVFSNWAQYRLVMKYLCELQDDQTLVMYSGHPLGVFPSSNWAPRVVVTNGMVIPNYSKPEDYDRMYAQGNTQFGQMTAGSYCYIGPQGIVHGTTITLMNAARKFLGSKSAEDMKGKVFVTAGLGGMSGAQPKAGVIAGMIAVVAEVDPAAWQKRYEQGWIQHKERDLEKVISMIKEARKTKSTLSIGWLGNVVTLWERLAEEEENIVDLGSDQTSLHNPFQGGYYPVTMSFEKAREMMANDPAKFRLEVHESLRRHVNAVNRLSAKGMKFWDYGNAFLFEASRAGADVWAEDKKSFKYKSYFEDFMGDIFSLGFGPFRWVCLSMNHEDLKHTDKIAQDELKRLISRPNLSGKVSMQYADNLKWIEECEAHQLVVGSEARILYSNSEGRVSIALKINEAVAAGKIGPVMLSRDHHDVSGTDSPFRETSSITDGSKFCADMATHNFVGDAFRGATSVSLHNGGGTGWGQAINGGFLLMLDGTKEAAGKAKQMLYWDVNNGVARRAWSGNSFAQQQISEEMQRNPNFIVTLPHTANTSIIDNIIK